MKYREQFPFLGIDFSLVPDMFVRSLTLINLKLELKTILQRLCLRSYAQIFDYFSVFLRSHDSCGFYVSSVTPRSTISNIMLGEKAKGHTSLA